MGKLSKSDKRSFRLHSYKSALSALGPFKQCAAKGWFEPTADDAAVDPGAVGGVIHQPKSLHQLEDEDFGPQLWFGQKVWPEIG